MALHCVCGRAVRTGSLRREADIAVEQLDEVCPWLAAPAVGG